MASTVKGLALPNGAEWNFIGRTYYGVCTTAGGTSAKTVYISNFTSSDLVAGTKITVLFRYAHTAITAPSLNVSNTGAKSIASCAYQNDTSSRVFAGQYEWRDGALIDFVYNGYYWVIVDGEPATTSNYGKTMLTNVWASRAEHLAITPRGATSPTSVLLQTQYHANTFVNSPTPVVFIDTVTPATWESSDIVYNNISMNLSSDVTGNRMLKVTYGNIVHYEALGYLDAYDNYSMYIEGEGEESGWVQVALSPEYSRITITADADRRGAKTFKVEYFYSQVAGFVSYPVMNDILDERIGDIETLLASI